MTKFQLNKTFVNSYKTKKPPFGFNGLGEVVYRRTYSRLKEDGTNEDWYETVRRVVEGTYTMQLEHVKRYNLGWNPRKAQNSAQEMYDRIFNMKFLPPGRGLWGMGSAITQERKLFAALNNCFAGEEKFLTREGLKTFKNTVGTNQTILTKNGEWREVPVKTFGYQKIWELTLQRQGIQKVIRTTKDHGWFTKTNSEISHNKPWTKRETKDLVEGMRLPYQKANPLPSFSPQGVVHGFVFGDGTKGRLDLCNKKDEFILKYMPVNKTRDFEHGITVKDTPEHYKELPLLKYDRKYLMGWLMGYFAADGSCSKAETITISSSIKSNLTFVKEVCSILGIGSYTVRLDQTSSNFSESRELYKLSLMPSTLPEWFFLNKEHKKNFNPNKAKRYWNVFSVKETNLVEEVFCVQVKGKHSFTIEGDILTSNCGFCSTENLDQDKSKPFCFLMDMSMLGVGVGFDTKGALKLTLHEPCTVEEVFIIPDSREGWVKSLEMLLESYFNPRKTTVKFDYSLIRAYGKPIEGFGGKCSGPAPLRDMHESIRDTLSKIASKGEHKNRITVTAIVDIMNLIGVAVVAGNVRRSAEIAFGDPRDDEFLDLKNPELHEKELAHHRWASNNTIFGKIGMNYANVANRTRKNGEPGYAWLENMQAYGRMADKPDWKDKRAKGGNPCLEQTLESYELCCLVEVFPNSCTDFEDFIRTLKYAYLYAKTVTLGQSHWPDTNRVMLRNRRIGCSMSGIVQFLRTKGLNTYKLWCENGYSYIKEVDKTYSDWLCIPTSIKCTSVKPSGSVSKLPGATSGIHWPIARYCKVRVRVAKNHHIIEDLKEAGYSMEECVYNSSAFAVEFPVDYGEGLRSEEEVSCWEKIALASFMQKYWSDNQVSATITFDPELEGKQIEAMLNYYQYQLKGVSFLPMGGAYKQMSYEPVTKAQYDKMVSSIKKIKWSGSEESVAEKFCDTDACQI